MDKKYAYYLILQNFLKYLTRGTYILYTERNIYQLIKFNKNKYY